MALKPFGIAVDFISASRYTTLSRARVCFTAVEGSRESVRGGDAYSYRIKRHKLLPRKRPHVLVLSFSGHYISICAILTLLRGQVLIAISLLSEISDDL